MRSALKTAKVLLAFVICSTIFSDYWAYSKQYHDDPNAWMDIIHGTGGAPMQYRIGVVWAADLLRRHLHLGLRHTLTLIDLACALAAVYLLFSLFEKTSAYRIMIGPARWFGAAVFVILVQYYFGWITWYQRPETLASAAVLAATMWFLTVPIAGVGSAIVSAAAMLTLAAIQGFIRADVAVAIHLGVLVVCFTKAGSTFVLSRGAQVATSLLGLQMAAGIQFYLMRVVYPHASYGDTPVIQIASNLTLPVRWFPFALFMLPWGWLLMMLLRRRSTVVDAPGMALAVGSAIYMVTWLVVGKIDEVRIFLPYALALIPLTCAFAMQRFVVVKDIRTSEERVALVSGEAINR